jgi:hypothetical protein
MLGCGRSSGPAGPAPRPEVCASDSWQVARRALLDGMGLPARRAMPGQPEVGEPDKGDGFTVAGARWPHPEVDGEFVHGLIYAPDPPPPGPVPLLLNVHGHWGGGVSSDEVNRRAQVAARGGWLVLSIAGRGMELGGDTPGWRQLHHRDALYAQLRSRRSGGTPLGWDVVAGWSAVDLAAAGRLPLPVDMQRIGVMGFSGGAERAAAIAATDPRVGPVVIGAYEYAFSSGHGQASCSCGVVRGAGEPLGDPAWATSPMPESVTGYSQPVQSWRWLALAACQPGAHPAPRPLLAWDNQPEDVVESELLLVPGVEVRTVPGIHGVTPAMAAASWGWMEAAFGAAVPQSALRAATERAESSYLEIQPRTFLPLAPTQPAPGQFEQGPPPWRVDALPSPAAARAMLAVVDADGEPSDPGPGLRVGGSGRESLTPAPVGERRAPRTRAAWLVVEDEAGTLSTLGGLAALQAARPEAVFLVVRHRLLEDGQDPAPVSRFGIEQGVPALGVVVYDVLQAYRRLVRHPEVDPAHVGMLALGSAGVAALQAALLVGEVDVVALAGAPVTLFFDGPRSGERPFAPWPEWTMVPLPGGASFDPWLAARSLEDRVRWLGPRGGDGTPWTEHLPHGAAVETLEALLAPDRRPR